MSVSLYQVAEKCRVVTEKRVSIQILVEAVKDAYGYVAKKIWFENTQFDSQEIDGSFVSVFKNIEPLIDCDRDIHYIVLPSSYLILPHEIGIVWVSGMKDKTSWVRVQNWGIFNNLKSSVMGGKPVYEIEGNKMLFPKMTSFTKRKVLLKLAIAYNAIDPYEQLNIGPNIVNEIIAVATAPYLPKQNPVEKVREIIN